MRVPGRMQIYFVSAIPMGRSLLLHPAGSSSQSLWTMLFDCADQSPEDAPQFARQVHSDVGRHLVMPFLMRAPGYSCK